MNEGEVGRPTPVHRRHVVVATPGRRRRGGAKAADRREVGRQQPDLPVRDEGRRGVEADREVVDGATKGGGRSGATADSSSSSQSMAVAAAAADESSQRLERERERERRRKGLPQMRKETLSGQLPSLVVVCLC